MKCRKATSLAHETLKKVNGQLHSVTRRCAARRHRPGTLSEARRRYAQLGAEELTVVVDGRHDILNDASHRSVAATVVLFLERLRSAPRNRWSR